MLAGYLALGLFGRARAARHRMRAICSRAGFALNAVALAAILAALPGSYVWWSLYGLGATVNVLAFTVLNDGLRARARRAREHGAQPDRCSPAASSRSGASASSSTPRARRWARTPQRAACAFAVVLALDVVTSRGSCVAGSASPSTFPALPRTAARGRAERNHRARVVAATPERHRQEPYRHLRPAPPTCTSTSSASAAPSWAASPRSRGGRPHASPAATRTSIRRCARSSARSASRSREGYDAAQLDVAADADVFVVGNAMSRGNPLMEAILDRGLPYISGPNGCATHVLRRPLGAGGRRHARQDHHHVDARVDPRARGPRPGFLIGGVPRELRRLGAAHRQRVLRDRGRRVRHRVLRQALEVRPLPPAHCDPQQPRIRPRRHLPRPRRDRDAVPPPGAHRARRRPPGRQRRGGGLARVLARGCWTPVERFAGAEVATADGTRSPEWRVAPDGRCRTPARRRARPLARRRPARAPQPA